MTDLEELAQKVKAAAGVLASSVPLATEEMGAGKLYEAWFILELGLAFKKKGWDATWSNGTARDNTYTSPSQIVFRGGPGSIRSSKTGDDEPGFVALVKKGHDRTWEIHNSLRFLGFSGVRHEVDIAFLTGDQAEEARNGRAILKGLPSVALELKNYTGDLELGVTRSWLFASLDLGLEWSKKAEYGSTRHEFEGRDGRANLAHSYVALMTTSCRGGRSKPISKVYGALVLLRIRIRRAYSPGSSPRVAVIANQILFKVMSKREWRP